VKRVYVKCDVGEEERDGKQNKKLPRKIVYFKRQASHIVDV